jgi:4-amino-4-deoxy-L-arabinose transferase-like glycosyltransferase
MTTVLRFVPAARERRGYIALVLLLYSSLSLFHLGFADLDSDEGRFGISALNILADLRQLAIVSQRPLGEAGTLPYMYPLALAASVAVFGKSELSIRLVNVIAVLAGAILFSRTVRMIWPDSRAGLIVFGAFLLNAGTIVYARTAIPDTLVVPFGCAALFAAAKASSRRSLPWGIVCGVALGAAFLVKLWLVFPFVLACGLLVVVRRSPDAPGISRWLLPAAAVASFLVVSGSHLLIVRVMAPDLWLHWLNVYFGFTLTSRFAGDGYDPGLWYRPWWFYLAALFKASFFGLPVVLLGSFELVRTRQKTMLLLIAPLLSPAVLFSFLRVKQATYIYPTFLAVVTLLAVGLPTLLESWPLATLLLVSALSTVAALLALAAHVITPIECLLVCGLYGLYIVCAVAAARHRRLAQISAVAALVAAMFYPCVKVVRQTLLHRTYFHEIAAHFEPALQATRPTDTVFTAPEAPAMEFYTYRHGVYWDTFRYHQSYQDFIMELRCASKLFYVVDRGGRLYGGQAPPDKVAQLELHAVDVTPSIQRSIGRAPGVRVFTPLGPTCR